MPRLILSLLALVLPLLGSAPAFAASVSYLLPVEINAMYPSAAEAPADLYLLPTGLAGGVPVGKWLQFSFIKPMNVTRLTVVNGSGRQGMYGQYARVKSATLSFSSGQTQKVELQDTASPQSLELGGVKTSFVRFAIDEVYPGENTLMPYLSRASVYGYDPQLKQQRLTGRFMNCTLGRSEDLYWCTYFQADSGERYGCSDDLCFHPQSQVNVNLEVIGVVREGGNLQVLQAKPLN